MHNNGTRVDAVFTIVLMAIALCCVVFLIRVYRLDQQFIKRYVYTVMYMYIYIYIYIYITVPS